MKLLVNKIDLDRPVQTGVYDFVLRLIANKEENNLKYSILSELVKCEKCNFSRSFEDKYICLRKDGLLDISEDDYCSKGKRKSE